MNIRLHIERLMLDGLPVASGQLDALQAAVEAELTSLLAVHGVAPELMAGGSLSTLAGGPLGRDLGTTTSRMGFALGRAIHGALGSIPGPGAAAPLSRKL